MRILNLLKLSLVLASVVLLGFAAVARADEDASAPGGVPQTTVTSEQSSGSVAAESPEAGQPAAEATPAPVSTTDPGNGAGATSEPSAPEASPPGGGGEPLGQPQPDVGAADPDPGPASSPAQAPPTSASAISQAVQEAIAQASANRHSGSAGGGGDTPAAEANATTQLIWQVQVAECAAHCSDTTQYQLAEQRNTTQQTLTGVPTGASEQTQSLAGANAQATTSTTAIQLGCVAYCFGTTTTSTAAPIAEALRQVLEALLSQIAAGLPGLGATTAAEQATLEQISYQSQGGPRGTLVQAQSASQSSTTAQSYDASAPDVALGGEEAASYEAVNQTEQGIWQLQIGCLIFCEGTQQYQQADQINTTVQTYASAPGSQSAGASVTDRTTQLIWQAQIGCIFWCFDATEQQTATANDTSVAIAVKEAPPPPDGGVSQSTGSGSAPAAPAGQPPSSGPGWAEPSRSTGSAGGSQALATPIAGPSPAASIVGGDAPPRTLAGVGLAARTPNEVTSKSPVGVHRSHPAATAGIASALLEPRHSARATLAALHAKARRGPAARSSRARDAARFVAGSALGGDRRAAPSLPAGLLLAAIALLTLCCLRIAVLCARRASRASHADS